MSFITNFPYKDVRASNIIILRYENLNRTDNVELKCFPSNNNKTDQYLQNPNFCKIIYRFMFHCKNAILFACNAHFIMMNKQPKNISTSLFKNSKNLEKKVNCL